MQCKIGVKGDTLFKVEVGACQIAHDFFTIALGKADVDDGCLSAELGVDDFEDAGAGLGAPQEVDVEGEGVWLVLGRQGGGEVQAGDGEEVAADDAAVGDWEGV